MVRIATKRPTSDLEAIPTKPQSEYNYDLTAAFPNVDPGVKPLGSRILVQIRSPRARSKGGILLTGNDRDAELWNEMTAKVIALGPLAYKNRTTMEPWPEGDWVKPGQYVRVPKYGGDRLQYGNVGDPDFALFVTFNDHEVISAITGDPLTMKTTI